MREIVVGAAQMGPNQKSDSRADVIARMIALLKDAHRQGATLVVFPELALTTFFPRWWMETSAEIEKWFEREMPNAATQALFDCARSLGVAISFGYAERASDGRHYNTQILTDQEAKIIGKYRKVHLPGHDDYDPDRAFQHLEKRYFAPGDLGFPVWRTQGSIMGMCICNDRRWPEVYRVMGLQGVELIMLGYNTPSVNSQRAEEGMERRLYHSELVMTAGAYQNATWVIGVAKAGIEDGHPLMAGTIIIDPNGIVAARARTDGDEVVVHACDMDACAFGKATIFDFDRHRRIEHYGRITEQTGVIRPD